MPSVNGSHYLRLLVLVVAGVVVSVVVVVGIIVDFQQGVSDSLIFLVLPLLGPYQSRSPTLLRGDGTVVVCVVAVLVECSHYDLMQEKYHPTNPRLPVAAAAAAAAVVCY